MPEEFASEVNTLLSWLAWVAIVCALLGLLATVGRIATAHRQDAQVNLRELGIIAFGCVLIGSAGAVVAAVV
ncbi:hypothetical protein [Natronoglycomyces albus]|uniref:Uncharacterized protein n=1 Tax=Natronoglycomyces albus TaxID=2811108 RepID=A0A895XPT7_9ACTN|nr:hypothetical protein [Natronoglycomyces albus]QSB07187.1 hypothetical protein JQS30_16925 [Natronoglycomyces albus]